MLRIITGKRLAALRAEAARLPALEAQLRQAEHARQEAEAAQANAAAKADADHREVTDAITAHVAEIRRAVEHPENGHRIQADIALHFMRKGIDQVKQSEDADAIANVRLLDVLLCADLPSTRADAGAGDGTRAAAGPEQPNQAADSAW